MIRITSKQAGFRRANIAHPAEPTDHADDAFTAAQLKQLLSEPMLVVEQIDGAPGDPGQGGAAKAKAAAGKK